MKKIFQISTLAWIIIILIATLMPNDIIKSKWGISSIIHLDKLIHFALFYFLFIFAYIGFFYSKQKIKKSILILTLICFAFGGLIEILQYYLPIQRSASFWDWCFDCLGSILGFLFINRYLQKRKKTSTT